MSDPLYDQVIAWAGLAFLLLLCLPFARIQKLVLEVSAGILRLALLAVLGVAAYLWFRPEGLPVEAANALDSFPPSLRPLLPEPGTPHFGVCVASLVVLLLLPLLAVLDVSRRLAGRRLRQLRTLAEEPKVPGPAPATPAPVARRADRRTAAATLAEAGARTPPATR
jgi:hypothetical protein